MRSPKSVLNIERDSLPLNSMVPRTGRSEIGNKVTSASSFYLKDDALEIIFRRHQLKIKMHDTSSS